jgi:hypothetical protein
VICQFCSSHKFLTVLFACLDFANLVSLACLALFVVFVAHKFGKITDFSLFNRRSFGLGFWRNFSFQFFYRVREAGILQRKLACCSQSYLVPSPIRNFLRTLSRCETVFRLTCFDFFEMIATENFIVEFD